MKLLKGTITRLKRELDIKAKLLARLQDKRDNLNKEIEGVINEASEISALIADSEAKEPSFDTAVAKAA